MADLYHLDFERDRYFLNIIQGFVEGVNPDVQLDSDVEFHLKEFGIVVRILRLNLGILENENPSGVFKYEIHEEVTEFDPNELSGEWVATSGSNPVTPTTVTITPALVVAGTFMAVTTASVVDGAVNIDPRVEITINFDSVLDKDTITRQGLAFIDLRHHNPVDVSLTILDADTVLLRPESGLIANTKYRLVLFSGEVNRPWMALTGEVIQQPYIINFTTGAETFTEVSEVTDPGRIERRAPIRLAAGIADPATAPVFLNSTNFLCRTRQPVSSLVSVPFNKALTDPIDVTRVFVELDAALGSNQFFANSDGALFFPSVPDSLPVLDYIGLRGQSPALSLFTVGTVSTFDDSDLLLITDAGALTVTFEIDATGTNTPGGGNVEIDISGAADAVGVADLIRQAIIDSTLNVTVDALGIDAIINVQQIALGTAGNNATPTYTPAVSGTGISSITTFAGGTNVTDATILDIHFTDILLSNSALIATFTSLEFADGTFFTGTFKSILSLSPTCANPTQLRMELGGFLSDQFTDCDLEIYAHKNAVDLELIYGSAVTGGSCGQPLQMACKYATVLDLFDDWISRNGAIGQSRQLGDFKVSNIPRPELIIGGPGGTGPYGRKKEQFKYWRSVFMKCIGPMRAANPSVEHPDYPLANLRTRTWVLGRQASGSNFARERFTENGQDFPPSFQNALDLRRFT